MPVPDTGLASLHGIDSCPVDIKTRSRRSSIEENPPIFTLWEDQCRGIGFEKWTLVDNVVNLRAMTSTKGEVMALSGKQNPCPGKLGVIEEDA